jgi:Ni/Co efflux regulator RcnB
VRTYSIAVVSVLCAMLATPVIAGDKDHGNGHGHEGKGDKHDNDEGRGNGGRTIERQIVVVPQQVVPYQKVRIVDRDREIVRTYYRNEYVSNRCPPGLAKKDNGCLPPGQASRSWVIGQSLPPEIVYYPMPRDVYTQLTPPPYGYEYVRVDDNVMLISTATRLIAGVLGNMRGFD